MALAMLMATTLGAGGCGSATDPAQTPGPCMRGERALEVTGHSFTGRYLVLDVTYAGGCAEHTFRIWWSGAMGTSNPPVVPLEFHHYDGGDTCKAIVADQIVIDCAELDAIAGSAPTGDPATVRVNLFGAGWTSRQLIPELRYEVPDAEVPPPAGEPVVLIERDCGGITG